MKIRDCASVMRAFPVTFGIEKGKNACRDSRRRFLLRRLVPRPPRLRSAPPGDDARLTIVWRTTTVNAPVFSGYWATDGGGDMLRLVCVGRQIMIMNAD